MLWNTSLTQPDLTQLLNALKQSTDLWLELTKLIWMTWNTKSWPVTRPDPVDECSETQILWYMTGLNTMTHSPTQIKKLGDLVTCFQLWHAGWCTNVTWHWMWQLSCDRMMSHVTPTDSAKVSTANTIYTHAYMTASHWQQHSAVTLCQWHHMCHQCDTVSTITITLQVTQCHWLSHKQRKRHSAAVHDT